MITPPAPTLLHALQPVPSAAVPHPPYKILYNYTSTTYGDNIIKEDNIKEDNEQKALTKGNGWADLSHRGVISITGKDRLTWLHALTTQNLEKLQVATWVDALILDVQGHVIDQLFLVDDGQSVWLHLENERLAPVIDYLNKMIFMF